MEEKELQTRVMDALSGVRHPETGEDIVKLGLVRVEECTPERVVVELSKRGPNDPFGKSLMRTVRVALAVVVGEEHVEVRLAPLQPRKEGSADAHGGGVGDVQNIIVVGSGKGGVGKSTISVNLAVALARKGYKVGLLDADIFGPSMHIMLGVSNWQPRMQRAGGEDVIVPVEAYGVKLLSMGFFVPAGDALVWRGPMASNALKQLIHQGFWGELDYLLIDMPPGTSDIHLTLVQELALTGAVIVTTPQNIAVADARKALSMFRGEGVNVPVLGVVENMAWFEPAELPGNKYYLFGRDGGKQFAEANGLALLGQVPLVQGIREGSDVGNPVATENSVLGKSFETLGEHLVEAVVKRNAELAPTRKVEVDQ